MIPLYDLLHSLHERYATTDLSILTTFDAALIDLVMTMVTR